MRGAAPWGMSCLLLTTGSLHFLDAASFESIVPRFLGWPGFWVAASGVAELICAVLLAVRATRKVAGLACAVLFIVVYPANIAAAVNSLHGDGSVLLDWLRLPLQIPLILWALYIAGHVDGPNRTGSAPGTSAQPIGDPIDGKSN